jgi:3-oxoacyl-[acyl-carrier protein] reductase
MEITLKGKTVLITGGTRGIGRAIATACAEAGAAVAINYARDDKSARQTLGEIEAMGAHGALYKGDASGVEFGENLIKQVQTDFDGLDILVNNAAVSHNTPFLMLEPEEWQNAVQVNINALYSITKPFLRSLVSRKVPGKVLNITSVCGVRPVAAVPVHYAATKAAIVGFTYTLAREVGRYGISVNGIAPGLIETAFSRNLPPVRQEDFKRFCPLGRIGRPEEVAALALFLVSEVNSYMTGETVVVSGGL